ncbi:MacS family sensor histidine kinase [Actinomycetospora sp.]|uniref:MacS family sensor histidine kinase n=1 Tax=Actinomycetospora sp. TaxID=1872135 RepID=UPI002F404D13
MSTPDPSDVASPARRGRRGATVDVHAALLPLWRGLVVFRVVALVYAAVNVVRDVGLYARPALGIAVLALMAVWTLVTSVAYLRGADRLAPVDLGVTVLATTSTLLVADPARIAAGGAVITTVWSAGAVLAIALAFGIRPAIGAVAVSVGALWVTRRALDAALLSDAQLLLVAGVAVGFASVAMRRSAQRLQEAIATEAAAAERDRLARDIHDGVLQILALVRRRGPELGDPELVGAAAEQEVSLRRLITRGPIGLDGPDDEPVDLGAALGAVLPARAVLAVPPDPVCVPGGLARSVVAVVREAAANADAHAGPDAGLWVLLEDDPDAVTISVRDDGPGIPSARLEEAVAEGHLGVASSIRGRVTELGGTAELTTAPGDGVEWELRVPRCGRRGTR